MKKFLLIILSLLGFLLFTNNHIQALSVADFTPILDKNVANLKTTQEKVDYLKSFSDLLNTPKFTQSKNAGLYKNLREYTLNMLTVFEYELKEEQANKASSQSKKTTTSKTTSTTKTTTTKNTVSTKTSTKLPHLSDNFSNIDEQKVRNTILSRHNEERQSLGLNNYQYNLDLEGSASVRANKLAQSSKTKNLHVRNSGDGTYNYNSILKWFSDLGIKFPSSVKGASSFSESIGYGYYKCNKSDCTESLIEAAKKTRTGLIMKEKSYKGDHYRAAIMKHFTQMGAGIAIDKSNNRYYIVLHYGVNF